MKRLSLCFVAALGCGEPTPGTASQATVVFSLDLHPLDEDNCRTHPYIGRVAFGSDSGYLVTHAFLPGCSGDSGNPDEMIPSKVIQFDKRTPKPPVEIDQAGMTQEGGGPRSNIGARGTDAVWTFSDAGSNMIKIDSQSNAITGTATAQMDTTGVIGIVVDENETYFGATRTPQGPSNPLHPRYPCCGFSSPPSDLFFFKLEHTTGTITTLFPPPTITPPFVVDQIRTPLVANATTLFYWQYPMSGPDTRIMSLAKPGTAAAAQLGMIGSGLHPAGIAATNTHVAWSATPDIRRMTSNLRRCTIDVIAFANPTPKELLNTGAFSCFDLALDDTHVYFTIVEAIDGDGENLLRNRGLARIDIQTLAFESIELGIPGPEAGPRQVFDDGDAIMVVAPYVIARIEKSAFDNKQEIRPSN